MVRQSVPSLKHGDMAGGVGDGAQEEKLSSGRKKKSSARRAQKGLNWN